MKERQPTRQDEIEQLQTLSPEALLIMEELLNLEESQGKDVTEAREALFELFNEKMRQKETIGE